LTVAKLTTVQVTKSCRCNINKYGLTEDLYLLRKEEFSITCYM
jgi:hypothetical protein